MESYLQITRPTLWILTGLTIIIGALGVGMGYSEQLIYVILAGVFICAGGNVFNDFFDYDVDRIDHPERPIPSGRIERGVVGIFGGILFLIGNIFAFLSLNLYVLELAIANTFIIFLYNWKIKRIPVGHFLDPWFPASAFLLGGLMGNVNELIYLLMGFAYLSNLGRELGGGIEDIEGDKKMGLKTLTVVLGKKYAGYFAIICILCSVILSPILYLLGYLNFYYLILVLIADSIFVYACKIIFSEPKLSQKLTKLAMFISLIGFLAGLL